MSSIVRLSKVCNRCRTEKPLEDFYKNNRVADGRKSICKECQRPYNAAYYQRHKEYQVEYQKDWSEKNKDYLRAYRRQYQAVRSGKRRKAKVDIAKVREHVEELWKWVKRDNPEKVRASKNNQRAKAMGDKNRIDDLDIIRQFRKQDFNCYWCECALADDYHVDHVVPVSKGGLNTVENMVLSCPECNNQKNGETVEDFLKKLEAFQNS